MLRPSFGRRRGQAQPVIGSPTTFWGKLERNESDRVVLGWHPLIAHCADVAACAEALLAQTLLGRRLAALALAGRESLDAVDVARLAALAALHDIGKFNLGFQRKANREPSNTAGHVAEVLALFASNYPAHDKFLDALPTAALASWCPREVGAIELLSASIGHHGRPVRWRGGSDVAVDPALWQPSGRLDPFDGIASLVAATRAWFPDAFGSAANRRLPDAPEFQHAFAGLVMLADWLGSDREFFPFADDLGDRMPFARERARIALIEIGLDADHGRASLGPETPGFDRVSTHVPRPAQRCVMSLDCPASLNFHSWGLG